MNSIDIVRMSLKNLFRRKARTFLTVLGVIIGTAAIVIMISIGLGIKQTFIQKVNSFGNLRIIQVYPSSQGGGSDGSSAGFSASSTKLDDKLVKNISEIPGVVSVTPTLQTDLRFVSGKYISSISVTGIIPETMKDFDIKVKEGRMLQKGDDLSLVFGAQVGTQFYDPKKRNNYNQNNTSKVNLMKDKLIMTVDSTYGDYKIITDSDTDTSLDTPKKSAKIYKVQGVGLLTEGDRQNEYTTYMSIYEVKKLISEKARFDKSQSQGTSQSGYQGGSSNNTDYQSLMVKVDKGDNVSKVQSQIKSLGFEAYSLADELKQVEDISRTIQMVLGGIAAVSLFVASLGITNTMIMAIYERTREIGIMKVIGAQLSDIKKMFLFEAALIGLIGGIIGLFISFIGSYILNNILGKGFGSFVNSGMGDDPAAKAATLSVIPVWLMIGALIFTTIIGIVSGYFPAKRAMKLSPIEAIKTE